MHWVLIYTFIEISSFSGDYTVKATGSAYFETLSACKIAKLELQERYPNRVQVMCLSTKTGDKLP